MSFKFGCPGCGQRLEVEDNMAGSGAECPACGASFKMASRTFRIKNVERKNGSLNISAEITDLNTVFKPYGANWDNLISLFDISYVVDLLVGIVDIDKNVFILHNPVKRETILEKAYTWGTGLPDRPFYKRNFSLYFEKIEDEWLKDAELVVIGIGDSEAFHKRLNLKNLRVSDE